MGIQNQYGQGYMSAGKFTIDPKTDTGIQRRNKAISNLENARYVWILYIFLIILADQLSKWYVTEMLLRPVKGLNFLDWYLTPPVRLPFVAMEVTSFFNLVIVWNSGVSFGMFGNYGAYMPYILIAVALLIAGLFAKWMMETKDPFQGICFAMIIGGALGNVIDRARFGAVIDFLDLYAYGYHWPAFNIADSAVCIGVGLLIFVSLLSDFKKKKRKP